MIYSTKNIRTTGFPDGENAISIDNDNYKEYWTNILSK